MNSPETRSFNFLLRKSLRRVSNFLWIAIGTIGLLSAPFASGGFNVAGTGLWTNGQSVIIPGHVDTGEESNILVFPDSNGNFYYEGCYYETVPENWSQTWRPDGPVVYNGVTYVASPATRYGQQHPVYWWVLA
jgi:hypothetical protein